MTSFQQLPKDVALQNFYLLDGKGKATAREGLPSLAAFGAQRAGILLSCGLQGLGECVGSCTVCTVFAARLVSFSLWK